jgi:hypothetical protein
VSDSHSRCDHSEGRMDFICLCVRIPKCGSVSLSNCLKSAFGERRIFYLPHTLNLEGPMCSFQGLRFRRACAKNIFAHYRMLSMDRVYALIAKSAFDGDLISGGHIDFPSVRKSVKRPVKMITLFRHPAQRCRSEYNYCREAHFRRPQLSRLDETIKNKIAASYDFDGYLDFLREHASIYGDLAARYIGWDGAEDLAGFFAENVFHSGVLEQSATFVSGLASKMGISAHFPHDNRTAKACIAALSVAQRRKIEGIYSRDYTIYEWQLACLGKEKEMGAWLRSGELATPANSPARIAGRCML